MDELGISGYLPFSQAGGALLFHLLPKLYEHTSVMITNLAFGEWSVVFGDAPESPEMNLDTHGGKTDNCTDLQHIETPCFLSQIAPLKDIWFWWAQNKNGP